MSVPPVEHGHAITAEQSPSGMAKDPHLLVEQRSMKWTKPHRAVGLLLLRRSEHVLFAVLLAVGVFRSGGTPSTFTVALVAVVAAWYLGGVLLARRSRRRVLAVIWLVGLIAGCAALAFGSTSFVWLAFPLFLLSMQLLPIAAAVPTVALLTVGTVAVSVVDRGGMNPAAVLGPLIGAGVAVVITVVYRDLAAQVRERAMLIDQLTATRRELAFTERRAGTLTERERLAREIHDTVTQSLTSIVLMLRSVRDSAMDDQDAMQAKVETAREAADDALGDTRRLVRDLTPTELAERSLPDALERVVADQSEPAVRMHVEGEPAPVSTPMAVALLRTAQEALANVRAHAEASGVDVTLTYLPTLISLDIVDDGVGFDPELPVGTTTETGVGISGMRARACEVGGSLRIDTAPRQGTAVNITVPREGGS